MFCVYSRDLKIDKETLIRAFDTSKDAIRHITWCYERDSGIGQLGKYYYFMVKRKKEY